MLILITFLVIVFLYSLISRRLEKSILTAPMIFTIVGILVYVTQPELIKGELQGAAILILGEITLAVMLFTDASRISLRSLAGEAQIPVRLLVIGMPLTILLGVVAATVIFTDLSIWEAAILGVILAPTDASLGAVIVNSPHVPARVRQALNVEAGLNDGLSVPFLMLFIALAEAEVSPNFTSWAIFALEQVGIGVLTGLALGWLGGWLMGKANRRGWMAEVSNQLGLLALAVIAWAVADPLHGNGFIAAFTAGSMVKIGFENAGDSMTEFSEAWGNLLNFFVFFIFGVIAATSLTRINGSFVLYAVLSLTLVRMLPVAIAMLGMRLQRSTLLFMGWFGPRGLASIVLGLVFLEQEAILPGMPIINLGIIVTVLVSIFAHGISANPAIRSYARQVEALPKDAPELLVVD